MPPKRVLELVGAFIVAIGLLVALYEWHLEIIRGAQLSSTLEAQKAVQADNQKQMAEILVLMKDWQAQQDAKMQALDDKFKSANSPQQVAALVSQMMGLKQPIVISTPAATTDNPHPQPVATITDIPQLKLYTQECEECKVKLDTSVKQLTYADQQQDLLKRQITSLTTERDAAVKAVHGGSLWQRLAHDGKIIAISAGVGIGIGYVAHR